MPNPMPTVLSLILLPHSVNDSTEEQGEVAQETQGKGKQLSGQKLPESAGWRTPTVIDKGWLWGLGQGVSTTYRVPPGTSDFLASSLKHPVLTPLPPCSPQNSVAVANI